MALDEVGDWTLWPWGGGGEEMQVFLFLVGNPTLRMARSACLASIKNATFMNARNIRLMLVLCQLKFPVF